MYGKAVKAIHTYFLASLIVIFVWLISWPSPVEKLAQFQEACHLQAWLLLKELVEKEFVANEEGDVFDREEDEEISYAIGGVEASGRSEVQTRHDLKVSPAWPEQGTFPVVLKPVDHFFGKKEEFSESARIYEVKASSPLLPLEDYLVVFLQEGRYRSAIVPKYDSTFEAYAKRKNLRSLIETTAMRYRPLHWDSLQSRLGMFGYTGKITDLESSHPAVLQLSGASDPRNPSGGILLFGMQLSIEIFFSSVGFFLAAIAFISLGPLIVLEKSTPPKESSVTWIFAIPLTLPAPYGRTLEYFVQGIGWVWAAMPLIILALQLGANIDLSGSGKYIFPLASLGLVFSAIIFARINLRLSKARRASQ